MTEPFLGEVQLFAFNFAPRSWALANGALLALQQNSALFALIGVQYGGNGTTNFALPNLAARTPCGQGRGPGLTPRTVGETFGSTSVTLTIDQMPAHTHGMLSFAGGSNAVGAPVAGAGLTAPRVAKAFLAGATINTALSPQTIGVAGGNQPHENLQPLLAMTYAIALEGVFPSFS